eukprot:2570788-Rhodomonas_salina.2
MELCSEEESTMRVPVGSRSRAHEDLARVVQRRKKLSSGGTSLGGEGPVAVGGDQYGALAHDLEVRVNQHVGAVLGVAHVVSGHPGQVLPVCPVAEELGHEAVLAHALEAARRLGEARRRVRASSPGGVGAACEALRLEGAGIGIAAHGHEDGGQAVDLDARGELVVDQDLPGVSGRVEGHPPCNHYERRGPVQDSVALALQDRGGARRRVWM